MRINGLLCSNLSVRLAPSFQIWFQRARSGDRAWTWLWSFPTLLCLNFWSSPPRLSRLRVKQGWTLKSPSIGVSNGACFWPFSDVLVSMRDVRLSGKSGSDRRSIKPTRLTRCWHRNISEQVQPLSDRFAGPSLMMAARATVISWGVGWAATRHHLRPLTKRETIKPAIAAKARNPTSQSDITPATQYCS